MSGEEDMNNPDNNILNEMIERMGPIIRYADGTHITFQNDNTQTKYCSLCLEFTSKIVKYSDKTGKCPICQSNLLKIAKTKGWL